MEYPLDLMIEMKEKFKEKHLKPSDITIYYDIDNTLALFSIHGKEEEALKNMHLKGFYESLPLLDDGVKVIPVLQSIGFKVKIISACIDSTYCKPEKMIWIKRNLPTMKEEDIILCMTGEDKTQFVEDINRSILIDDYGHNLLKWARKGGYAIKKSYSMKRRNIDVINNHVEIFSILHELGCLSS